jgi:hypothetical protein
MNHPTDVTPFSVRTPETLSAKEAADLFVDLFSQMETVKQAGHAMLNGPRGCGKSMMFRFLLSDCQAIATDSKVHELPFFAILVSLKNKGLNIPELERLADRPYTSILNEHYLSMFVASRAMSALRSLPIDQNEGALVASTHFVKRTLDRLRTSGWAGPEPLFEALSIKELFSSLHDVFDELYRQMTTLLRRLAFDPELATSYSGPICGFTDLLVPLFSEIRALPFTPRGPVFVLMDDADYLTHTQTKVLNSWLASRSIGDVSIKVSTQFKYKTYVATDGMSIESPHDFTEIDVSDLYTASASEYRRRVEEIVKKRLNRVGIDATPEEFFPPDPRQAKAISEIADRLRSEWTEKRGKGSKASDDVLRYSRPIYIRSLGGAKKSTHQYNYAGWEQLVHISSGVVRYFLDTAAQMYSLEKSLPKKRGSVNSIRPSIQNQVVREASDRIMFEEFERLVEEESKQLHGEAKKALLGDTKVQLYNLIRVLGNVFFRKLVSDDSERRVFSVAFSDKPDPRLIEVFQLGVKLGYFHKSAIGNKEGTGRTPLYVLTRRLAPHFRLDPTGFAGYLFVTKEKLWDAIRDPDGFLLKVKNEGVEKHFQGGQFDLFTADIASRGEA